MKKIFYAQISRVTEDLDLSVSKESIPHIHGYFVALSDPEQLVKKAKNEKSGFSP